VPCGDAAGAAGASPREGGRTCPQVACRDEVSSGVSRGATPLSRGKAVSRQKTSAAFPRLARRVTPCSDERSAGAPMKILRDVVLRDVASAIASSVSAGLGVDPGNFQPLQSFPFGWSTLPPRERGRRLGGRMARRNWARLMFRPRRYPIDRRAPPEPIHTAIKATTSPFIRLSPQEDSGPHRPATHW